MIPEEKAKELFNSYYSILIQADSDISEELLITKLAKECAIRCVDELYNSEKRYTNYGGIIYFQQVKEHIQNI